MQTAGHLPAPKLEYQVGNGINLEAVGLQFEPYQWRPCGVTWDSSRTVVVIKLQRTSALRAASSPAGWAVTGLDLGPAGVPRCYTELEVKAQ